MYFSDRKEKIMTEIIIIFYTVLMNVKYSVETVEKLHQRRPH